VAENLLVLVGEVEQMTVNLMKSLFQPPSFGFLSYSDQPPGANANMRLFGHSKGLVLGDSSTETSVWITHSTPQFPFRRDQNRFWPDSGKQMGQSFLCVSLPFPALSTVGKNQRPSPAAILFQISVPGFPLITLTGSPSMLFAPDHVLNSKSDIVTLQMQISHKCLCLLSWIHEFHTLNCAHSLADGDLYVKLAKGLDSDLNAQTWGCQLNGDESFCEAGEPQVLNVQDMADSGVKWSTKRDHSKWAVSTKPNTSWTCFGDMNRSVSQYLRWGGAVCISNKDVNGYFKGFVKKTEPCDEPPDSCSSSEMFSQIEDLTENLEKLEL
uniref:deoxyribonuclease II n=1 Tax=Neogobius melanostomus TaxID=47308 RepID=A0A8C6SEP2_9GOBI